MYSNVTIGTVAFYMAGLRRLLQLQRNLVGWQSPVLSGKPAQLSWHKLRRGNIRQNCPVNVREKHAEHCPDRFAVSTSIGDDLGHLVNTYAHTQTAFDRLYY